MSTETKVALSPGQVDILQMWDLKIAETEAFLSRNPDPRLTSGARELLAEYQAKRAKAVYDFEHPAPAPPAPPTPELVKRINDEVQALMPEIVARVIVGLAGKK